MINIKGGVDVNRKSWTLLRRCRARSPYKAIWRKHNLPLFTMMITYLVIDFMGNVWLIFTAHAASRFERKRIHFVEALQDTNVHYALLPIERNVSQGGYMTSTNFTRYVFSDKLATYPLDTAPVSQQDGAYCVFAG